MDVQNTNPADAATLTLDKFKPFDAELIQAAQDYGNLVIVGVDDKKGYKAVTDAVARLTTLRTGIERTRVEIKAPAIAFGKRVDLEAKRLTDLIVGAEGKLRKEKQRIDAVVQQQREEAERKEMELFTRRADALFKAGFMFDGVDYVAGDLKILAEGLTGLTDTKFDECLRLGQESIENDRRIREKEKAERDALQRDKDERERLEAERIAAETPVVTQGDDVVVDPVDAYLSGNDAPVFRTLKADDIPPGDLQRIGTLIDRARDPLTAGRLTDLTKFLPLPTDPPEVVAQKMFVSGFESFREKILLILDRPDKFTRSDLRAIIQNLK